MLVEWHPLEDRSVAKLVERLRRTHAGVELRPRRLRPLLVAFEPKP